MKKAIAVIGEGIIEKYYIESLKGHSPFTVLPKELGKKASNLKTLESNIKTSIDDGFDEVYCLIDMDGKNEGKTKADYEKLKATYHGKVRGDKNKGIQCKVTFIETERCTELWFLYHFTKTATTKKFTSFVELEKELQKYRPNYVKTEKYYRSVVDLHKELTTKRQPNGFLAQAISNAKQSLESKNTDGRTHTFSEMHLLIEALGITC